MRITVEYLESLRDGEGFPPCREHLCLFEYFLGKRKWILPTARNLTLALKYGIDVNWFVEVTGWTGMLEYPSGKKAYFVNGKQPDFYVSFLPTYKMKYPCWCGCAIFFRDPRTGWLRCLNCGAL
jgi:hypothetical protein